MKVQFIKDFATKKKGDVFECGGMLASTLIHQDKVAKKYKKETDKK
jgi:hypothetical protein